MSVIETERLALRRLGVEDAEFIRELLNEPSFIENIGDRGVRTAEDACRYILNGPVMSYDRLGFGLYLVELKETGEAIGISGLLKREALEDVDIGFAFLPKFWGKGYAYESAAAVMEYGRNVLGIKRIVAVTATHNEASMRVLRKIGLRFERMVRMSGDGKESRLFVPEAEVD
ncbi:MAG: GNAT family N-acetyltransferase [Candidatus Acidiferrales bacterium]